MKNMKNIISILICLFVYNFAFCQKVVESKLYSALLKTDSLIENSPREFFKNVESLIVYNQGEIFFEKYYNGFNKDSLHHIQSQTKSVVALLMGIAIEKGFIKSENELVSTYFPESFNANDKLKSTVTIRDLLTMSAGFEWEELKIPFNDPKNDNANMFHSNSWLSYALNRSMACKPFSQFNYNSGCPIIVAGVIEKATKMRLDEFTKKYLFTPLGINNFEWIKDGTGLCHAGGGLHLKPADMLKIGIMVLNKGKWNGKQIVGEAWLKKCTTGYLPTAFDISSYGYFWWVRSIKLKNDKNITQISAEGAGGQKLYIFPDYNLIIAITERNYYIPQVGPMFIKESILPLFD
jgi:CubicO group peptidase (beta-lactamase class C family)